ncbi:TonB-dependent receptor [Chloroherpeton thalassium]|uniref:TonB-dependent receptor n=1 Tax=Chloroherpeton thalassium TaxID=100716 RepID=UPI00145EDCBA|nr:TonB-dependent receptor [Chloroherpeton thalassium]
MTDKKGEPIAGVLVQILDSNIGCLTNEEGKFTLTDSPSDKFVVKASLLGYQPQTKSISPQDDFGSLDFVLSEQAVEGKEILVTGKSPIQQMREAPEAISVIEGKSIRGKAVSIESVLDKTAGVKVRQSGGLGSASRITVHGLEGKRIQIMVDDNPLNSPDGSISIDDIPIDLIDRIEVYKGIVPARFGGDGLGGAVNIVTREYETDYIDLSYERSSYNTNRASWVIKKNFKDLGIRIGTGGFYNYAQNNYTFNSPYEENLTITRDHDLFESYIIGGNITFTKLWFDEIELEVEYYNNEAQIQGIQENIQHALTKNKLLGFEQTFKKEGFFDKNLDFELHSLIGVSETNFIDTAHLNYDFYGNSYASPNGQGEIGWTANSSEDKITEVRERLNLNYKINPFHSFNLNTSFRYSKKDPKDELASENAGYDVSGYPNSMYNIISGLTYEAKLNGDKFINLLGAKVFHTHAEITALDVFTVQDTPETKGNTSTKFGTSEAIRWRIWPFFNLKASYQHALRLPTPDELFGDGVLITPAGDLKPEVSNNFNLGFYIDRHRFFGFERVQLEVNGFYMHVTDMIKLMASSLEMGYENLGEVEIKGVEAELKVDLSKMLYAHTNVTYQDARDVMEKSAGASFANPTKGLRVPNMPYFFANFGVEYHAENLFGKDQFSKIYWDAEFTEEYYYNWKVSNRQSRIIPQSFVQDIGIQHSFHNQYTFTFEVHNIFDNEVWNLYRMPLPGRTFHVKFRYTLMGKS